MADAVLIYLHRYERYLRSSGGAWSRVSGYSLQVRNQNNRNIFYTTQESISIQDPYTQEPKIVPLLKPNEPTKTLGVWMQPDQDMTRQLEYMSTQVKDWITKIGFSHLPTYHKRVSFSTRLMAQLSYPLPVLIAA